jgi:hypothetical protein
MPTREEVYAALDSERAYQKSLANKVGDEKEHKHELESFTVYIQNYLNELTNSLSRVWRPEGIPTLAELNTLRKITALGVAAMEMHGAPKREGF